MCVLCFLLRLFSVCVCNSSQCVCGQVASGLHCFLISVCGWYSEHVCVCGVCLPHACCPRGVCACPSPGLVFSACGVCEQVGLHSVPTCGLMTSVCEQLHGSLFCTVALEFLVECVFTFMGRAACAGLHLCSGVSRAGGHPVSPVKPLASQATRLAASVPTGGWLCLRPRPLAGWCHVGLGLAVAGRAGQGLWWALDPRPDLGINILSCWRLCLLGPSLGVVAARQVLGGGGDQATAESLPSGQTGHSLAAPSRPLSGWGRGGDPSSWAPRGHQ